MSDEVDIELAKLKYADEQAKRDFWKWVVMGIGLALNPFIPIITSIIEQRALNAARTEVVEKADVAATEAARVAKEMKVVKKQADENYATNLKTNIAVNDWRAKYDRDPMAEIHANESRAKLEERSGEVTAAKVIP